MDSFRRLSKDVVPIHYDLTVVPNLESFKFTGNVKIDLKITRETDQIELHSLDLKLSNIQYESEKSDVNKPIRCQTSAINESETLIFERPIEIGSGKLSIDFEGTINESSNGFYKTRCLSRDGCVGFAAATQFEAAYARKAFPCFDEPSFKATFDITIAADKSKTVLSNMPVKKIVEHADEIRSSFVFERSPLMSTYLVAYVVGEYDFVEKVSEEGTLVRVYTPVGMSHLGRFSLELSIRALKFFTSYFEIGYQLPKLDLIGLGYVDIEAMENYGLLVFKESLLLIDSNNYSAQSRAECALTVCHEIAHQWFGNLVTMEWWTDLWLNEGFATYVEYVCVDACFPEWNIWNLYSSDHLFRAFNLDSLRNSHPIEVPVDSPAEINQIFDSISYCKGSSVLRMLNDYVGGEAFLRGLRSYLKRFKFGNATSDDLWEEMDRAAPGMNVKRLMQVWTKEKGYPLVRASKRIDPQTNHTILSLEQSKFTLDCSNSNILWNIPISVLTKTNQQDEIQMLMREKTIEVDLGKLGENGGWIKLNKATVGFYLVEYSSDLLKELLLGLKPVDKFASPLDRFGIIIEAFSLASIGKLPANDLMNLICLFKDETDCYVWITLIKNLQWLSKCLLNTQFYQKFAYLLSGLFETIKTKIGFQVRDQNESDQDKLLRANILYMLAKLGDPDFERFARNKFANRTSNKIDADLQRSIYTSVLQSGGAETVDEFIAMYKDSKTPEDKERIALLLGEVLDPKVIQKVLQFAISDVVTLEETVFMIITVASNPTGPDSTRLAWEFIKNNWPLIYSRYHDSALLGRLLKRVLENFSSPEARSQIEEFFNKNEAPQASYAINQAMEIIESNISFIKIQSENLEKYFNQ